MLTEEENRELFIASAKAHRWNNLNNLISKEVLNQIVWIEVNGIVPYDFKLGKKYFKATSIKELLKY